jgi:glutathione S-transferase
VNPFGKLPALSHGDVHIFESGAMLLYLHDLLEKPSPGADTRDAVALRGRMAAWVLFANCTMGNGLFLEHLRAREMPGIMTGLTAQLADGRPFLELHGFSVADVAVGGLLLYLPFMFPHLANELASHDVVAAYLSRLAVRPSYKRTLGARISGATDGTAPMAPSTRGGLPVR